MVVCKFFLEGRCKFGDKCRHEHPAQSATSAPRQSRDVFATSNRPPANRFEPLENRMSGFSGDRGRGGVHGDSRNNASFAQNHSQPRSRGGGFQPRDSNRDRRNDVISHRDAFGLTAGGLESELKNNRPRWIMSCYGPGDGAPIQLFGGHPLEQSPEELRTAYYLALANGSPQEYMQLEQELVALSNQQVDNVLNDLHGAIEYVAAGKNQHPNRLDELKDIDRNVRHGLFSTSNQRAHRGVFRDQKRPPREAPPAQFASNLSSNGLNSQARPQSQHFGSNAPFGNQAVSNGFGTNPQPNSGFGQPSQVGQTTGFNNLQPSQTGMVNSMPSTNGWPQTQQPTQNAFNLPQQDTPNNFSQPLGSAPIPQFALQQPPTAFGHPTQQASLLPPGSPMDSSTPNNNFGPLQFGNLNAVTPVDQIDSTGGTFGASNPQRSGFPNASNAAGGSTFHTDGNPPTVTNLFSKPQLSNTTATNPNTNGFDNGVKTTSQINGTQRGSVGQATAQSELEQAYRYMAQHGQFKNNIVPETPPEPMWLQ